MLFTRKPIIVEAERVRALVSATQNNWKALPEWIRAAYEEGNIAFLSNSIDYMKPDGYSWEKARIDDWLIFEQGLMSSCSDELFKTSFDGEATNVL